MVLGSDDAVAGRAFPRHAQVHELAGVVPHVEGASGGTTMSVGAERQNNYS